MALKDWKKIGKTRVINGWDIDEVVYVRKSNKNDILVLKYHYRYVQYNYPKSFNRFEVLRNNISLFRSNVESEAFKYITEYMRKH